MTEEQKQILTNCIPDVLKFYQYGQNGCTAEPGGFASLFERRFPELFESEEELILMIDKIVVSVCNSGKKHPPG